MKLMSSSLCLGLFLGMSLATTSQAQVHILKGSDTLAGVMTDAIIAAGLQNRVTYQGGGSGLGETAMVSGEQAIGPMSREFKPEALALATASGMTPVAHVIGLDGLGIFVKADNSTTQLTLEQLRNIYTCQVTEWDQLVDSGRTGHINAYRRDDHSGTTDTFKSLVGVRTFGDCVTSVAGTVDISHYTSTDANAIGYAGLEARADDNKVLSIGADSSAYLLPTVANIRSGAYPLSRKLLVYEATGSIVPNAVESELLVYLLDRSFLDPILQDHHFFTID